MSELVIVIIMLTVSTLGLLLLHNIRQQREQARQTLQEAGFFELPQVDRALVGRVRELLTRGDERPWLRRAFRYTAGNFEVFLFDPQYYANQHTTVVVHAPDFRLPRFALAPRVKLTGVLGALANKLGVKSLGGKLRHQDFITDPEFGERYYLFGDDDTALRALFTGEVIRALVADSRGFHIEAEGNLLLFHRMDLESFAKQSHRSKISREMLAERVQDALKMHDTFAAREPSPAS
jgi:hypothetical protein